MPRIKLFDLVLAVVLCAVIALSSVLCAGALAGSRFYRQSRIVSMLISHDSVGIPGLLSDSRGIGLVVKFGGALAAAYINFEMIPLNESGKFMAVLEGLPENITVDRFEYHGRDLVITGRARSGSGVAIFEGALARSGVFGTVTSDMYESVDGSFKFSVTCPPPALY